ncbi:hypothetical protein [Gracilimonas mengyeensis]|uniref:Uncharacterized protein n=1 Tax=Gracilimonas mengyeensis TaxID=1302730 RepID=A0A521ES84_9BACT|nr:hypothetical protein [Gracilimonas mengyeensis]SMO86775.1 hypothetical protein SAMN06265219_11394 [Gracilimonas mengyeensis]
MSTHTETSETDHSNKKNWSIAGSTFISFGGILLFQNLAGITILPISSFIVEISLSILLFAMGIGCFIAGSFK